MNFLRVAKKFFKTFFRENQIFSILIILKVRNQKKRFSNRLDGRSLTSFDLLKIRFEAFLSLNPDTSIPTYIMQKAKCIEP